MNTRKEAENYYKKFSKLKGNEHIANLFAIEKLLDIVKFNRPNKILEIGLGIGSISYSIIDYLSKKEDKFVYFGTEANEFCLEELPKNLGNHYSRLNLFSSLDHIDTSNKFDLIIIDGSDNSIEKINRLY